MQILRWIINLTEMTDPTQWTPPWEPSGEFCYGNPANLAPELLEGEAAVKSARTVVYSLGVSLYKILTGVLPFEGGGLELIRRIRHTPPRKPRAIRRSVPKELELICLKAMARKPEERYATPGDLAQALRAFLGHQPERKTSLWKHK